MLAERCDEIDQLALIVLIAAHNFSIIPRLIFALTTPPTPKAGTILPILASALTPQSLTTLLALWPKPSLPCLLYKSKPSRCIGVEKICMAAGATNCAVFVRPDSVLRMRLNLACTAGGNFCSFGAMSGGRLKLAKIVIESLAANNI